MAKTTKTAEEPALQPLVKELLTRLGEHPERDGLRSTPQRVERSLRFLTSGYRVDMRTLLNGAVFEDPCDEMVVVKDMELYSMCEHHMLPFFGKCHVGYIPRGKIVGLSKLPRIVDAFARRLQVQERLTTQIAQAIESAIKPRGVAVVIEARHLCMMMRGVEKQNSSAVTSCMLGGFKSDNRTRSEFLAFIGR